MNNENSKKENIPFVLNDVIKRKILDMYKISTPENIPEENEKSSTEK